MSHHSKVRILTMLTLLGALVLWGCSSPNTNTENTSSDGGSGVTDTDPPKTEIRASGPDKALDPGKLGPYPVGVTTFKVMSTDVNNGKPREVIIEVWYPATEKSRSMPTDAYDLNKDGPQAAKDKIKELKIELPVLKQNAHRDAELLRSEGPYPLILYSHGSGGVRFQSVFQTVHLASHGYVVASADHIGNTIYDLLVDNNAKNQGAILQSLVNRPVDIQVMFDEMKKRNKTKSDRFFEMLKTDVVGMTGHSFGGLASILVTKTIKEIGVIIPQTPVGSLYGVYGVEAKHLKDRTIMVMASKDDRTLEYNKDQKYFYDTTKTGEFHGAARYLVTLEKGGHFSYSDICSFDLKKYASAFGLGDGDNILTDGCADFNTPVEKAHPIINHYATALFNVILRKSTPSQKYLAPMEGNEEVSFQSTPAK